MNTPESQETNTTQAITSMDQLLNLIVNWHSSTVNQIQHLSEVPESEKLEVTDEDTGEVVNLTGKEREAFIQGLLVAKTMLLQLPFTVQESTAEA